MGVRDLSALLDTHALYWWLTDDRRLSKNARRMIVERESLVSVVSLWEIEIKRALGRVEIRTGDLLAKVDRTEGFSFLEVRPSHVASLVDLPPLHKDPFDRMLVAQAVRERVPLISRDRALRGYPIDIVW